ncbi:hypothetical protein HY621_00550 [Candidatus Uhrbacteria bacterium]|nr:hypothetical protein [Candidatus Uhrbacteria bacterium]
MPLLQEEVTLDSDEKIIGFFRPHIFFVIAWGLPLALGLVVLFIFMFKIFQIGVIGVALFFVVFFFFVFLLSSRVVAWYGTLCVLTNRRLLSIRRVSLLKKQVTEVLLGNISELSYTTKGIIQTILRFGNVHLTVFATNTKFTLHNIPYPQQVMDVISGQIATRKGSV